MINCDSLFRVLVYTTLTYKSFEHMVKILNPLFRKTLYKLIGLTGPRRHPSLNVLSGRFLAFVLSIFLGLSGSRRPQTCRGVFFLVFCLNYS